jgi:LuxR family quorum-sensing system transcriptional regulator SolR
MDAWQEDRLNALLTMRSEQELFSQLKSVSREMGFEYCAYGIQMPLPISRPVVVMFNNYAAQWQKYYLERGYLDIDPTVRHGLRNTMPLVWSNEIFESAAELWEEARAHGLHFGWAQSSRDTSGAIGMLTLARSTEQLSELELSVNTAKMMWLTQYAHAAMCRLLLPKHVPESQVVLTAREREVLRWTAEGKTAYEIGQILSVSERTINFHVNNIVTKLGASNKTQAAVKAAALGLLI